MNKSDFSAIGKAMAKARIKSGSGEAYNGFYNAKMALLEMFDEMGVSLDRVELFEEALKKEVDEHYEAQKTPIEKMRERELNTLNARVNVR